MNYILSLCVAPQQSGSTISISEKNKDIIQSMINLYNKDIPDAALNYFSERLINKGIKEGKYFSSTIHEDILQTFPDIKTIINNIWTDGDWVIVDCTISGTHQGIARLPHHGGLLVGKSPTNKQFKVQQVRTYKLLDGKIVTHKEVRDDVEMYRQLGILQTPSEGNNSSVILLENKKA